MFWVPLGSKDHSALDHELLPAHCWVCYNTVFTFTGWIKRERNLGLGDTILVESRLKTGKGSYRVSQVVDNRLDFDGVVRKVTLLAKPWGSPLFPLHYYCKHSEKFKMAVESITFVYTRKLEIPNVATIQ